MTNEITKIPELTDGLDTADDDQDQRVIQGMRLAFTNDYTWVDNNGEKFPPDRELLLMRHRRVLQKWGLDNKPIAGEKRFLEEGERWPDVKAMNEAAPRSEWREGQNGLQGPWQCQHLFYFLDPKTFERFTYPTDTTGGHIAVGDLKKAIKDARLIYGAKVNPVVTLSDTFMSTNWGGRQRPHFIVVRWIVMGGEPLKALPADVKALPAPPQAKPEPTQLELSPTTAQRPSLREELNDDLPDDLGPPPENKSTTKAPAARPTDRRDLKKPAAKAAARSPSRRRLNNMDAG
jgi:hypothetical protein